MLDPAFRGRTGAYTNVQSVEIVDPYTVAFHLKTPSASFPINLVMGIVKNGSGAANARSADRHRALQAGVVQAGRPRSSSTRFDGYFDGPAKNSGVVLKVVPDDTMRGLELRKGAVDLVVNDVAPDIVWQMQREGKLQIATGPGHRLRLHRPEPEGSDAAAASRCGKAIGYAIDRDAIVKYLRRGFASTAVGHHAADVVGVPARRVRLPLRPGGGEAAARRGGLARSRRRRTARRASR